MKTIDQSKYSHEPAHSKIIDLFNKLSKIQDVVDLESEVMSKIIKLH